MISEPVLKDLQGAQKTHKIAGIALETRQGVILGATFVLYTLICYYLAGFFGVDPTTAAIAFSWILPVALVFGFVRVGGKPVDFWLRRKYLSLVRPDVLVHAQANPDDPTRALRNSVQRALPSERFYWEMLACKDGTHLICLEVEPVGLSLVGEVERLRVFNSAVELYNRIDFPIIEFVRSREGSTARYTRRLRDVVGRSIRPEERDLASYAEGYLSYLEDEVTSYNIFERRAYIIIPYNPRTEGEADERHAEGGGKGGLLGEFLRLLGFGKTPSKRDARRRQAEAEASYSVLMSRLATIVDALVRMGCRARLLSDTELAAFMKEQMTGWDPDSEEGLAPKLFNPLTLEHAGYEKLSEEELQKVTHAADEVREAAPIAFASGELSVAEKVCPDTVRIFPDYLRVEGRYHTTLYVSDWADEVYFGMLEALTHIEGRIKLVKYIFPQPKDKALKILGARIAALRAAERTADDGNVASAQQRDISRFTNEAGMHELTSDRQRYLEVACLIHVEADTEEALSAKVKEVRTALAAYRTEAKVCREEAWEGFLSCTPHGKIYNAERYLRRGVLSRPTACLFSFGTHQIDHPNGVFVGVDQSAASPITLNNRDLMNPHAVIIGQSGGGKTFLVKCLASRQRMLGRRIVIVDPEANSKYGKVARALGGEFALIAPGSPNKINPFDLHDDYLNIDLLDDAAFEEDDKGAREEAFRRARSASLNGKVQEITRMVSLKLASDSGDAGLSGAEAGYVERAVYECYVERGITRDPATHHYTPPTFRDFYEVLRKHALESAEIAALYEKLYSWHTGPLSEMFDSQTNVDLKNKFLVFQVSKVKNRQKPPVMHAVLEFMNGILSNADEEAECYIDEAWSILKDPMAAEFAETMWRSARARNCGMCAISQQPAEFFNSSQGEVILALSATHMIFRHEHRQPARVTASYYDFSEEEEQGLLNLQAGEGYLVVGQTRVPLKVMASPYEEELFNTKPRAASHGGADGAGAANLPGSSTAATALAEPSEGSARRGPTLKGSQAGSSGDGGGGGWTPYGGAAGDSGGQFNEEPDPLEIRWEEGRTSIHAFVGCGASETAARVARTFAMEAPDGECVLAVDATGGGGDLFWRLSDDEEVLVMDSYLLGDEEDLDRLGAHVRPVADQPALMAAAPASDTSLSAFPVIAASRQIFGVVIVACQTSGSSYAEDWLQEADTVVGCFSREERARDALEHVRELKEMRGRNGSLICTSSGSTRDAPHLQLEGRRVYALGGAAGERTVRELCAALVPKEKQEEVLHKSSATVAGEQTGGDGDARRRDTETVEEGE